MRYFLLPMLLIFSLSVTRAKDTDKEVPKPTWELLFKDMLAFGKQSNNVWAERYKHDHMALMWANIFHDDAWYEAKDNEFKRHKFLDKMSTEIEKTVKNNDTGKTYRFLTLFEFGKYDFKKEAFPIIKSFKGNKIKARTGKGRYYKKRHNDYAFSLPHRFYFVAEDVIPDSFPVSPEKAESFVNSRNSGSNRKLYVAYNFTLDGPGKIIKDDKFEYDWEYDATITRVEIHPGRKFNNPIAIFDGKGELLERNW